MQFRAKLLFKKNSLIYKLCYVFTIHYQKRFYSLFVSNTLTMVSKYTNIALPDELINEIDKVIKESGLGYKSRGEIAKEAVRKFLKELAEYKQIKKSK